MSELTPRFQVFKRAELSGQVLIHDECQLFCVELKNISAGGLYLKDCSPLRWTEGRPVRVVIKAKGLATAVQAQGKVVRVEAKKGLAVEFTSISHQNRSLIQDCVTEARMRIVLNRV